MKRTPLLNALKLAAHSLGEEGAALPALSHICFEGDSFYAYNDITAVIIGMDTGLNLGLHGATLLGVLGAARAEDIEVKVKDHVATITGAGKTQLPVLDKKDFIFSLPEEDSILTVPLSADVKHGLEMCLISVADDSKRPEYNGVTIRIGKTGTVLISCDNKTLTRVEPEGAKLPSRREASVVLPKVAADLVLKLFPEGGNPTMSVGERIAVVEFGDSPSVTLVTKLLAQPSTRLDDIFKQHISDRVCPIPDGFENEVSLARVLTARESLKECTIEVKGGEMTISTKATLGNTEAFFPVENKTMQGTVTVDPDLVARVLAHSSSFHINPDKSLVFYDKGMAHIISAVPRVVPNGQ